MSEELGESHFEAVNAELQRVMKMFNINPKELLELVAKLPESPMVAAVRLAEPANHEASPEQREASVISELADQLAEQLRANQDPAALGRLEQELKTHELNRLADGVVDWVVWLTEKTQQLAALPEDQAVDKLKLWHRSIDYFLTADPSASLIDTHG